MTRNLSKLFSCAILAACSTSALAQAPAPQAANEADRADDSAIEDIVVTATRDETRAQDTAISMTALSGEALRDQKIVNVTDLAQTVPNMQIGASAANVRVAIRGVGLDSTQAGAEGRVAYHVDGVYIARPRAIAGTFFDVDRVEVLRGPQGTLYGRNATGGAVNVISNKPTFDLGGYVRLGYGSYDTLRTEAAANLPLSDKISVRIAEQTIDQNKGYGRNLFLDQDINDRQIRNARGQMLFRPSDSLEVIASIDYQQQDDHNYQDTFVAASNPSVIPIGLFYGGTIPAKKRDIYSNIPVINDQEYWGASLNLRWDFGGAFLTSLTAYREGKFFLQKDQDLTEIAALAVTVEEDSKMWSQELRLNGDFSRGKWQVGVFGFWEDAVGRNRLGPLLVGPPGASFQVNGILGGGTQDTEALAGFGQVSFNLTDWLTVTAGARYSHEKKKVNEYTPVAPFAPFDPNVPIAVSFLEQKDSWSDFTPNLSLEFRPAEDLLLYATYSKGFKSGGFSVGSKLPSFDSESLKNYEVGVKADWLSGRLRTNASLFYYDYTNLQLQQSSPTGGGATIIVLNAKGATIKGGEAEIVYMPIPALRFAVVGSVVDTKYDTLFVDNPRTAAVDPVDLVGRHLTQAPPYTVNASAQYTTDTSIGEFSLRGEVVAVGRTYFHPFNFKDILNQPAHTKVNAFLNYTDVSGKWTASLWVRNLTNKLTQAASSANAGVFGGAVLAIYDPPRTYGLEVGVRF